LGNIVEGRKKPPTFGGGKKQPLGSHRLRGRL